MSGLATVAYRAPGSGTLTVTLFADVAAAHKRELQISPDALARLIEETSAAAKEQLPLLKLARFGNIRSERNSLRHDANLVEVHGLEGDHDLGEVSLVDAQDLLVRAGVLSLLYPSPSYTPDFPKWRVLCPFSRPYPPAERDRLMARLQGLFHGTMSHESWTLSQAYFYGRVANPDHRAVVLPGNPIDLCPWLDIGAIGPDRPRETAGTRPAAMQQAGDIEDKRLAAFVQRLLDNIGAVDDEKHAILRDNCRMLGGILRLTIWTVDQAVEAAVGALRDAKDWNAARTTARWAIERGIALPVDLPDRPAPGQPLPPPADEIPEQHQRPAKANGTLPPIPPPHPPPPPLGDAPLRGVDPTEDGVALAFAHLQAGRRVFDHSRQRWYLWTGLRWQLDEREVVFTEGRSLVRAVRNGLPDDLKELARIKFSGAVERAAKADPRLAVDHSVWDTNPWLLGTPGGVVNLRTGQLCPSEPHLYVSRHTSTTPVDRPCPLWLGFLHEATRADTELQGFLQRFFGYCLTGDVTEEVVVFMYGKGGNGKGTVLQVLAALLDEYAVAVPIEVFTAGSRINLEYYRAIMAGARLVSSSETEAQATWAEQQIKDLTGNDTLLTGRHPYGRPFSYRSQAKILIIGNHAPRLRSRSPAMERRLRVVPFDFIPADPDPTLKDKLKDEYPAILQWAVQGCLDWQHQGLGMPAAVRAASAKYFENQDAFARWIDERCDLDRGMALAFGVLLANYNSWAKANGEEALTSNAFAELVDRHPQLERKRTATARLVYGIGLKATLDSRYPD